MKKGVLYGVGAYALWGFFPLYFRALEVVPATQIMCHRVVWSFLFLIAIVLIRREFKALRAVMKWKTLLLYLCAGVLLAVNWLVYVWAVNAGYVVETSLGYFINPMVSVLFGVLFLKERLRPVQWIPIALAAAGVIYLTVSFGALPWIALALAFSFALYSLVKKIAPLGSLQGLTLETMTIALPALGFLLAQEFSGVGAFGHTGVVTTGMLAFTGVVTAIPLLLFASSAQRVPLTTLGLLQYIAPTIQFFIGIFMFGEPFTAVSMIGYGLIWLALILFSLESFLANRRAANAAALIQTEPNQSTTV